jgi:hypothetical protein
VGGQAAPLAQTDQPGDPPATDAAVTVPAATQPGAATQAPSSQWFACLVDQCGPFLWDTSTDGSQPQFGFPVGDNQPYDISPLTGRLLYSSRFPSKGAGPGNASVSDLWVRDLVSGQDQAIFTEEAIVKALWAPDGQSFLYIRATPETYELHLRSLEGADRLLARDVAWAVSFSPSGRQVAFTRESGYNLNHVPGIYVLDLSSGQELRLSELDKHGVGSLMDRPVWSPDERFFLLPMYGPEFPVNLVMVAVDGSGTRPLGLSAEVQQVLQERSLSVYLLWHPDGRHLLAKLEPGMVANAPAQIVLFELNENLDTLLNLQAVYDGDAFLAGWAEPGRSFWVRTLENRLVKSVLP